MATTIKRTTTDSQGRPIPEGTDEYVSFAQTQPPPSAQLLSTDGQADAQSLATPQSRFGAVAEEELLKRTGAVMLR